MKVYPKVLTVINLKGKSGLMEAIRLGIQGEGKERRDERSIYDNGEVNLKARYIRNDDMLYHTTIIGTKVSVEEDWICEFEFW